jgi:hypothetical protein
MEPYSVDKLVDSVEMLVGRTATDKVVTARETVEEMIEVVLMRVSKGR